MVRIHSKFPHDAEDFDQAAQGWQTISRNLELREKDVAELISMKGNADGQRLPIKTVVHSQPCRSSIVKCVDEQCKGAVKRFID